MLYIQDNLYQHGEYLIDLLRKQIIDKKLIRTGNLLNSLSFKMWQDSLGRPVLAIRFLSYGRALEIRWHKGKNRRNFETNVRRNLWALKNKKIKDTRWYTRTVYGSINRLMNILASDFSENEKERLKNMIDYW